MDAQQHVEAAQREERQKRDWTRAGEATPEIEAEVLHLFAYHGWNEMQQAAGQEVRRVLGDAFLSLINVVPPSPTRTRALNMLLDCRMLANQAITFRGQL